MEYFERGLLSKFNDTWNITRILIEEFKKSFVIIDLSSELFFDNGPPHNGV